MSDGKTSVQIGPGFFSLLTLAFVLAKLTGHIDWSWWLVFLPMFVGGFLFVLLIVLAGILTALGGKVK